MVYPYLVTLSAAVAGPAGQTRRTTCHGCVIGHNQTGAVVLTVAHFFDTVSPEDVRVHLVATGSYRRLVDLDIIAGTDLALVVTQARYAVPTRYPHDFLHPYYPSLANAPVRAFERVLTVAEDPIPGTVALPVPYGIGSMGRIRVRRGALVVPDPGRKVHLGDSGSPVLRAGEIVGVQSLVFNPWGVNTGLSTIACVLPHRDYIRAALA